MLDTENNSVVRTISVTRTTRQSSESFGNMRIHVEVSKCQGYGNCVAIDAKHFDLDDDGLVVVLQEQVEPAEEETTTEAIRSCPVSALWLEDER